MILKFLLNLLILKLFFQSENFNVTPDEVKKIVENYENAVSWMFSAVSWIFFAV